MEEQEVEEMVEDLQLVQDQKLEDQAQQILEEEGVEMGHQDILQEETLDQVVLVW